MKKLLLPIIAVACVAAVSAQATDKKAARKPLASAKSAAPAKPSALDKTVLENYVRHIEAWDHSINVEVADPKPGPMDGFLQFDIHASRDKASKDVVYYVSKDGKHIVQGTFFEAAENPYKPALDKLKGITPSLTPNYGFQGAPVVIVEFSDFECPFCKEEAKTLRSNIPSAYPKEVHLYHMDMPLEVVHPWARAAAMAAHCVYRQSNEAFWSYYDWIYDHQADITLQNLQGKVLEWAKGNDKIDSLKLSRCMESKETDADINLSTEMAKTLGVDQTPVFFINGRRMPGAIDWPTMKHIIDEEIEYQKTAKNAGEDCGCSVTLPSMGASPAPSTLGGIK